jgi:ribonuclease HI
VSKIDEKIKEFEIYTDGSCIVDKKNERVDDIAREKTREL